VAKKSFKFYCSIALSDLPGASPRQLSRAGIQPPGLYSRMVEISNRYFLFIQPYFRPGGSKPARQVSIPLTRWVALFPAGRENNP